MAESSDTRFLNVCRRHLDIFKADTKWNHSNPSLKITALEAKLAGGRPIAEDVWAKVAPLEMKINERQAAFEKIAPRVRASRRYLKSSGATKAEIADANTVINKILGQRSMPKSKLNPNNSAAETEKTHSVSHQSYDSKLGNTGVLRETYANISAFKPNEDDIKLTGFDALIDECRDSVNAVSAAFVPALDAWNLRDAELYNDDGSILEVFRAAKEYYKSLYPPGTPQYKAITAKDMTLQNNSRK
ncbi:MAG: hypothetical protein ABWZ66_05350 [Pyrinomonadaceae bacterium]